ncbi:MAG: hypothetical protein AAGH88_09670 [Planctomycetota bacterium]
MNLLLTFILPWTLALTLAFELVTVLFRFGFKLQATRDTARYVARWSRGLRIHHGYWGVPLSLIGLALLLLLPGAVQLAAWAIVIGLALIKSDLIHHFLVLWPITGHHEFHLVYPKTATVTASPQDTNLCSH